MGDTGTNRFEIIARDVPDCGLWIADFGLIAAKRKAQSEKTWGMEHGEVIANFELRIANLRISVGRGQRTNNYL